MIPTVIGVLLMCFTLLCLRGGGVHVLHTPQWWWPILRGELRPIQAPDQRQIQLSVEGRTVFDPATQNHLLPPSSGEALPPTPVSVQWSVYGPDDLTVHQVTGLRYLPQSVKLSASDSHFEGLRLDIEGVDADAQLSGRLGGVSFQLPPEESFVLGLLVREGEPWRTVTDPSHWSDALEEALKAGRPASLWTLTHRGWVPSKDEGEVIAHAKTR